MIILTHTTDTLNVDTMTAGSIDYTIAYADHTSSTFTANSVHGSLAAIQSLRVLDAPGAGVQRQIKSICLVNRDTTPTAQTVCIKKVVSGTDIRLTPNTILGLGESLIYSEYGTFEVRHRTNRPRQVTNVIGQAPLLEPSRGYNSIQAQSRSIGNATAWMAYAGKAPRDNITQVSVRYRVAAAGVALTRAEIGVHVGTGWMSTMPQNSTGGGAVPVQGIGYVDWLANAGAIGNYTSTITLNTPLRAGDDVWISFYNMFTTSAVFLRANVGDDLASGFSCFSGTTIERRPSLDIDSLTSHPYNVTFLAWPWFAVSWG